MRHELRSTDNVRSRGVSGQGVNPSNPSKAEAAPATSPYVFRLLQLRVVSETTVPSWREDRKSGL